MSDQQRMDDEFKSNGRPQSTIARNFSASLNSTFNMDDATTAPHLENLVQSVEQKKAAVNSQSAELQALEARIRETEARLAQKKQSSRTASPAGNMRRTSGTGGSPHRRQPLGDTFGAGGNTDGSGGSAGAAFGATGSYYGPGSGQQQGGGGVQQDVSSGGRENLSASTKSRWMASDEAVGDGGQF